MKLFYLLSSIGFAELSDNESLIGFNMNVRLDLKLDKSTKSYSDLQATKASKHFLSDFNLRDVWRAYNPTSKEYIRLIQIGINPFQG